MAKQTGDILFYGTRQGGNGYIDREGRAVYRQKPGPERKDWKRKAAFKRTRAAAADYGTRMAAWWAVWRRVPKQMRLLVVGENTGAKNILGLGDGWKGGFAFEGDGVPLGLDVELEGPGANGRRQLRDHASGGHGPVGAIRVWGLGNLESGNLQSGERKRREFLPVAGHHVTGGMGGARSKQRKQVVAMYWNSGKGLTDRREMELERWDGIAKGKGFADREAWFRAMAGTIGGNEGMNGLHVAEPDSHRVRVRLHWCVVGDDGTMQGVGNWLRLKDMLRVRLPKGLAGALFLGLEFGFVRRRPNGSEVLLALPCLNRLWYCGMRETVRKYGTRTGIRYGSTRRLRVRAKDRVAVRGRRVGVVARLCDRQAMCYIPRDALWASVPLPRGISMCGVRGAGSRKAMAMCGERDRAGP